MASLSEIVQQNTVGGSDGTPVGVPSSYTWYKGVHVDNPTPPSDFTSVTSWGQVFYKNGAPAYTNGRVEVANTKTYVRLKSTGDWVLVQNTSNLGGAEFAGDFSRVLSSTNMTTGSNGSTSIEAPTYGNTEHFWPNARGTYSAGSVDAVYVQMDMRVTDPNLKLIANVGADWWRSANASFEWDMSNNPGVGGSNWVDLTTQWQTLGFYSTSTSAFKADPPPSVTGSASPSPSPQPSPEPTPTIAAFSPDSGTVGDGVTSANVLTLTGKAEAGSTVAVFDGSTQIGTTKATSTGAWTYKTGTLSIGSHSFRAKATDSSGNTSTLSSPLTVKVEGAVSTPTPTPKPDPTTPEAPSGTNLLTNGSFESSTIPSWGWAGFNSVPGWTALSGGTIELWNNLHEGVKATNGTKFGELDYLGGRDGFYQNTKTVAGQKYNLSFDARARPGFSDSNTIEVLWNDKVVATVPPGGTWKTYNFSVTGTGGSDRLTFREAASQSGDGVGALYDNVKLVKAGTTGTSALSTTSETDRSLALMTQYSASSFTQPSTTSGVVTNTGTSSTFDQTLAQQHM